MQKKEWLLTPQHSDIVTALMVNPGFAPFTFNDPFKISGPRQMMAFQGKAISQKYSIRGQMGARF